MNPVAADIIGIVGLLGLLLCIGALAHTNQAGWLIGVALSTAALLVGMFWPRRANQSGGDQ